MYCGTAKAVINPPVGAYLAGYENERPCIGIHDPIHAKILALEENNTRVLIISLDLVAADADYVKRLRTSIKEKFGIPEDRVMVHATHTHSGPGGIIHESSVIWKAFRKWWAAYSEKLIHDQHDQILKAVRQAINKMEPCTLFYGEGLADGIASNRIRQDKKYTPELKVLEFRKASGKRIIVYNFACHPTVLHAENLQVSADYPGAANSYLESDESVESAIFLNGPCGDVSTRFTRKKTDFSEVDRIGKTLSNNVTDVIGNAIEILNTGIISKSTKINLNIRQFQRSKIMETNLVKMQEAFIIAKSNSCPPKDLRRMESEIEGAKAAIGLADKIKGFSSIDTEIQILKVGGVCFIGLPGEIFHETGQRICNTGSLSSGDGHLILAGNSNDYIGYLVPQCYYAAKSYESFMTLLQEDSADIVADTVKRELLDFGGIEK